jgi:choline dehydrogenase-like flavoprotein
VTSISIRSEVKPMIDHASETNRAALRPSYDYVVVGAGAAGCVLAGELSASGAHVLLIESGGTDEAPTVLNPSVWFYNVGGPLDYSLPIVPTAGLNRREFKMALGHVLGGGSSINANYLETDQDRRAIVGAINAARELGHQQAFNEVRDVELIPGPHAAAQDVEDLARTGSASFGHAAGTCKMGIDKLAVVDPDLRVHGLEHLRVADASVMPRVITGPTNAPTQMIAGKAAQLILAAR